MFILKAKIQTTSGDWVEDTICVSKDVELLKLKIYNTTGLTNWYGNVLEISTNKFYIISTIEEC